MPKDSKRLTSQTSQKGCNDRNISDRNYADAAAMHRITVATATFQRHDNLVLSTKHTAEPKKHQSEQQQQQTLHIESLCRATKGFGGLSIAAVHYIKEEAS